ncbi:MULTISPECIES: hypothetical protein [Streptomyces]|uniref:Uncharacterized protein n=3 Tax=Streptomyces rimosus TaxID=1927 RepID=A0A8A1UQ73_STRR1|nr:MULTISPECIES: hypothetical protein [Streptomyces]MYT44950.1 hypothetical protein [Streptomyces sp. SID5471]QDA07184.1 hypothetical protein CTZ40_28990 [Streptomyces rimosus]QEV78462.1 hypothetical protein CP984_28950 [Streptomyces rimosus]QGY70431.1 hypothetical protein V519_035210 [Streptomyces rimosus R6-500]QST80794.1 hypothetical protein SRIM_011935 [Streptomyces rimosus subsp. rimosus ATCC 10970]
MGRPMPQPGEPLWTEEDRAWALALAQVEADTCPDCGQPWSEVSAIDAEFAYGAELLRCHACATGARAAHRYQESGGDPRGLHVSILKR